MKGEELCPPWPGDHGWGAGARCPHPGEGCLLYMPHLLILDKLDSYKSCVLHSSFMGQHFLHPGTYVHLQKTAIFPSEWCQLGFGEVCWTYTALFSLLGGEGGCWVSDTRMGLCWRPTCCPGTSPIEFCQWHRQSALAHGSQGLVGQAVPALCFLAANSLGKAAGEGGNRILNQMVFL